MLRALEIRDMLIIDRLELGFQPGLNVLTGETGAGKSILLDALGFVLGWRGRADLVRTGAARGEVVAVFDLPESHAARAVLDQAGLPAGDELILRRVNNADGRKTAWVNDRRCSTELLRALSARLVELYGQQDDAGLLNPRGHCRLLDDFAGAATLLARVRGAWAGLAGARQALADADAALQAARADEEFLRHAVAELDVLAPQPGEDGDLDARRRMMQGAERIRADVARAHEALGRGGAEAAMGDAVRWLEGVPDSAGEMLETPVAALGRALIELDEAQRGIETALAALSFDPSELEQTEERLFAIRALARKHGCASDDLAGFAGTLRDRLAALDAGAADLADRHAALAEAEAAYEVVATELSAIRHAAAGRLDVAVMAELAPLRMERAVFETRTTRTRAGPEGHDQVTFMVATNPGAPAGPLNRVASGGEMSRFLLAMKVCLSGNTSGLTMIFDEIDRGVGGATADAVGRRLAALGRAGQVLVVTHSPQVAARGDHHWQVTKQIRDGTTFSVVSELPGPARVDEIARMLAGDTLTDAAREAARVLLAG